ncbi:GGDEF domain-containing protein [Breoghania sp. L-A4]|uniref:GGDEF domain-containing protein n=1 Tax=Breoghania sp. L-A4 TaxID=2304600 RepID=UPI000E35AE42|nr:GGDEF domain-containing protein [Breoghania sp. L-A4]AXS40905.1 GGDEF domain-containing protein [Breoghania sp. L-A4]
MNLDISTLLLLLGTLCFLVGITLLWVWRTTRQEVGLFWWGISFLVRAPAFPLIMARGYIPDWISIDVAVGFLMLGLGTGWYGSRGFSGRPMYVPVALAPLAIWLFASQVPALHDDTSNRMLLISGLTAIYSSAVAIEFWRCANDGAFLRRGLAILFAINGGLHAVRGIYSLVSDLPYDIMNAGNGFAASMYFPSVILMIGALLGVALHNDRTMRALRQEAEFDSLTNVLTRKAVFTLADREISRVQQDGGFIALLLFDLDHFKTINDSHGHQAGDMVLLRFCETIGGRLRKSDLFGRIGGEEFVAMLPDVDGPTACRIADELRRAVDELSIVRAGQVIPVSVSIGVACARGGVAALDALMQEADEALYGAKQQGRNQVQLGGLAPAFAAHS